MLCRICESEGPHATHMAREMMFGLRDEFPYFQCRLCGCLQITEYPPNLERYYPLRDYYSFASVETDRSFRRFLSRQRDAYLLLGGSILGKAVAAFGSDSLLQNIGCSGLTTHSRVLDVGCGSGGLLNRLYHVGFRNLVGADPYLAECRSIAGVTLLRASMEDLRDEFDLIMLNHSLEHMRFQQQQACHVARLLAPNGTAMIRVPIVSSYAWKTYGVNWVQLDAPRHLYLHSIPSLKLIVARAGMRVTRIGFDSTYFQFTGSEMIQRGTALREATEADWASFGAGELRKFARLASALNSTGAGDQVVLWLAKAQTTAAPNA